MDREVARGTLGLDAQWRTEDIDKAYQAKKSLIEERMAAAPTDTLRAKYQSALNDLEAARQTLMDGPSSSQAAHLSKTQMADLPGAQPMLTKFGGQAGSQSAARSLQPGEVIANRYEIRARIGEGGMGAVYHAYDRNRQEDIAVKVLLPHLLLHANARERFLSEAKISITLAHPNIVNVFDVQRDGDIDFITMELLKGQTLREVLQARKSARKLFSVDEALVLARAIGSALEYAHKRTVHRDVKPENIWVTDDGSEEGAQYKLMDFGIARVVSKSQMTQTAMVIGSAYYMAPEQLHGLKDVDGRADQYSLAVVLYEMLLGEIPAGRIKPLRERNKAIPRGFSDAIDKALSGRAAERFPTMGAFLDALKAPAFGMSTRQLAMIGGGAVAAIVIIALAWPMVRGMLPSKEQDRQWRAQALQAQGIAETVLKRLEASEREFDNSRREAKSQVDRLQNSLRNARSNAEREELETQLAQAKRQLQYWEEVQSLSSTMVFKTEGIAVIRGQINAGVADMRDNHLAQAAEELKAAQQAAEALSETPTHIKDAINARTQAETILADLTALAGREKETVATDTARAGIQQGNELMKAGKYKEAIAEFNRVSVDLTRALNELVDKYVAKYKQLAEKATEASRLDLAETAVRRAKSILALKR